MLMLLRDLFVRTAPVRSGSASRQHFHCAEVLIVLVERAFRDQELT
uniref:Uncharacterized protein n=1 Tax=Anguilla anguilla TaxID=7936 RepID=A0A0E9TEC1_ANGAN